MKWLKRSGLFLLSLPFILIAVFIFYEILGICVNHMATKRQTDKLQTVLEQEISDIQILDVYSETGNTSGTGNHVDCLSVITFSTNLPETELADRLSDDYVFDDESCYLTKTEDGHYVFYLNTSAPFVDNIEGH